MKKKKKSPLGSFGSTSIGDDGVLTQEKSINTNMRIRYVHPNELKINPLNSKYFDPLPPDEYETLKKDIEKRGIQDPVQVKLDDTILAGENRLRIALELNLDKIPIVYKDVSDEKEEIKFIIGDNLLRRHLTVMEKKELIKEMYGDEIDLWKHGGDRRSEESKKKEPLTKKVSRETGISYKTTERYLSDIRKENKEPGEQKKTSPSFFNRMEKQLNSMKKNMNKSEFDTDEKTRVLAILKELTTMVKKM